MKKLLLTFLAAVGMFTAAEGRELRFYLGDQLIEKGSTVAYTEYTATQLGPNLRVSIEPPLYIWSDMLTSSVTVTAKCETGENISLCCGGDCINGTDVTKNNVKISGGDNGMTALDLHYASMLTGTTKAPTLRVNDEAVDSKASSTRTSFTIVMGPDASGIDKIDGNSGVSVTSAAIRYDLPGEATVALHSITGAKALEARVAGSGTLEISGLPCGIYIYSVRGAGVNKTGKLVIRK